MITIKEFINHAQQGKIIKADSETHLLLHKAACSAQKITSKINGKYKNQKNLIKLMSKLTGKEIDKSLVLFPPFYTDFGKNINIGKDVFINSCCCFQDQGGITIGDGVLIGHQVVLATLNHLLEPKNRKDMSPKPINIGNNVWIGSNSTILQGVTIGDNSVVAAGSVVTKNVLPNTVVGGVPAKIIRYINEGEKLN